MQPGRVISEAAPLDVELREEIDAWYERMYVNPDCFECMGRGYVVVPFEWRDGYSEATIDCPRCHGSGREPA